MPRGGYREGCGRPKGAKNKAPAKGRMSVGKSVTLPIEAWEKLEALGGQSEPPVTAQKYAQAVLLKHIGR